MISDSMVQQATTLYLEPQPKAKSLDMRQLMPITTTAMHDMLQCMSCTSLMHNAIYIYIRIHLSVR